MDYQTLMRTIQNIDPADLAALGRLTAAFGDLTDPASSDIAQKLINLETVFHEVHRLSTTRISPDKPSPQERYLTRIGKMSVNENSTIPVKVNPLPAAPNDLPYFKRLDIVWVHFGGIGSELDDDHLAIVWDDNHGLEDITVIPTTSQFDKEYPGVFQVGKIDGLPDKKTTVSVDLMTRISRKRIIHRNGRYVQAVFPGPHVKRILWAIASMFCEEETLHNYVRKNCDDALPAHLGTFKDMRYMPIRNPRWDKANSILYYERWNDTEEKHIIMKQPTSDFAGPDLTKMLIYDRIFSGDGVKETLGRSDFTLYYS